MKPVQDKSDPCLPCGIRCVNAHGGPCPEFTLEVERVPLTPEEEAELELMTEEIRTDDQRRRERWELELEELKSKGERR